MADTTVRISDTSYSNLVKARGMLESFHEGRLSLDDAVFISARFTYEVSRLVMKEMDHSLVFVTGMDGHAATGAFQSAKLARNGDQKLPQQFIEDLMDLTKFLLRKAPKSEAKEK